MVEHQDEPATWAKHAGNLANSAFEWVDVFEHQARNHCLELPSRVRKLGGGGNGIRWVATSFRGLLHL